jgi:membrane associated rhomboid family serine protease
VLIPLGTDRALRRPTLVTPALIAVNLVVYFTHAMVTRLEPDIPDRVGEMLMLAPGQPRPWTYLTYAFMHASFMHVAGNMAFLWVFGRDVEDRLGRVWFLLFYLVGGAAAGAGHAFFYSQPVIGASGAVAAVTGAFLVFFPRVHVRMFCFFFIIGFFTLPAWWFIVGRITWDMMLEGTGRSGSVATLAHLAGYGFGFSVAMLMLLAGRVPREPYDLLSIFKHAKRRRQFKEFEHQRRREEAKRRSKPSAAEVEAGERLARARADVAACIARGDLAGAAERYRDLLSTHGQDGPACVLSRRQQYDLANHLYRAGDYHTAVTAYELFLRAYPRDPEAAEIKVLLGRIAARYLNDPVRARQVLSEAIGELRDEQTLAMAKQELADLG